MTVLKEPLAARPTSQHRHSSSTAGSLPKSRPHSQSMSGGTLNPAHRVTRRKSMSSTAAANVNAMAAIAKGMAGAPLDASLAVRRTSKPASAFRGPGLNGHTSMATSVPSNSSAFGPSSYNSAAKTEAVTDGPPLASMSELEKGNAKNRARRASEGSRLSKGEGKRASGSELRCETCGKGYKHSSCLTKHLWEHTPEWQYTSKLLISKHQQVQLLEAASVLVAMNQDGPGEPGRESDHSSMSPPASGSSDLRDDLSSTDTTPPPQVDDHPVGSFPRSQFGKRSSKRYSANSSSAYSQSYQSAIFSDNGHYRQWSNVSDRPTTSGTSVAGSYREEDTDQADLAAVLGLLSCSYGTPKSGPVTLPPDVPPVPPLPAKFLNYTHPDSLSGNATVTAQQSSIRGSGFGHRHHESKDVDMDDDSFDDEDEDDFRHNHSRSRGRAEDDDDGIFGRMEE